jgi:CHC2 zinc finger
MSASFSSAKPRPTRIDTDRLRQQYPIADLVARYGIQLRRSGSSFTGRCPFHLDRVDRTSRCIRTPVVLFATDVVQAATPFRSCNRSNT